MPTDPVVARDETTVIEGGKALDAGVMSSESPALIDRMVSVVDTQNQPYDANIGPFHPSQLPRAPFLIQGHHQ